MYVFNIKIHRVNPSNLKYLNIELLLYSLNLFKIYLPNEK